MSVGDRLLHVRHRVYDFAFFIELLNGHLDQLHIVFFALLNVDQLLQEVPVLLRLPNEARDNFTAHPVFSSHLRLHLVVHQDLINYAYLLLHRQRLPLARTFLKSHGRLWLKVGGIERDMLGLLSLSTLSDLLSELLNVVEALPLSVQPDVILPPLVFL